MTTKTDPKLLEFYIKVKGDYGSKKLDQVRDSYNSIHLSIKNIGQKLWK